MKLIEQWTNLTKMLTTEQQVSDFWNDYYMQEKKVYEQILDSKASHLEGSVEQLATDLGLDKVVFAGFLDGINTSLVKALDLESIEDETAISMDIDWNKLLFNMHKAKAKWLYTLPQWNGIFSESEQKNVAKEYLNTVTAVSNKVGRNDPCPCGSGKKYKKCCGINAE